MTSFTSETPCYIFHSECFRKRAEAVSAAFPGVPLTYSVKANPFLLRELPGAVRCVEVCSPGELSICERLRIPPEMILYSGVMKESHDIRRAIAYGAAMLTAESPRHAHLLEEAASSAGRRISVLLRLSSGNQFGMDGETIRELFSNRALFPHLEFLGLHYYSGTAKTKRKAIEKDLSRLSGFLESLQKEFGFEPGLVEYGPGFAADYFFPPFEETDLSLLAELSEPIREFALRWPLGIEMGRFLAAPAGEYRTRVKDLKTTEGVNYAILDGGIHQVSYFGQAMAMKIPPVSVLPEASGISPDAAVISSAAENSAPQAVYTLCGSLCTTADVLVREIRLPVLSPGDTLVFGRVGAYSAMEAPVLFLSRELPRIWLDSETEGPILLRDFLPADRFNS